MADLTVRYYLAPKVGEGIFGNPYRPKYFVDDDGLSWISDALTCQDYGDEPTYFVTANMTDAEHARILRTAADVVVVVPEPTPILDRPVGVQQASVFWERLEDLNFPALWIEPLTTYREVIRHLQRCIFLAQRVQPFGRFIPQGLTLDSHWFNVEMVHRQRLIDAVQSVGGQVDMLVDAYTLRAVITLLANQMPYPAMLLSVAL